MSHILIVEDEPDIGGAFEKFLYRMGHTCDVVLDGRTAYNKVFHADYDYDAIFCDLNLPRMTGIEFMAKIHDQVRWRTPIVVISGVDYMIEALGELRRGALSVVQKPIHLQDFEELVARALDQRKLYRRLKVLEEQVEELQHKRHYLIQHNEELHDQARVDPLTDLPNRRRLLEDLRVLDANWRRYESAFALVLCDVDKFGMYNKEHSVAVGDSVLQVVAQTIRDACRTGDVVYRFGKDAKGGGGAAYRFGGDEFVLLLAAQNLDDATKAVDRIRAAVEDRGRDPEGGVPGRPVTISAGVVANDPENPKTIEEMLAEANLRLKDAKAEDGNCVRPKPPVVVPASVDATGA